MPFSEKLKSKKLRLGLGLVGVLVIGFFLLKFMTSGGGEMTAEKSKPPTPRKEKPILKPKKETEQTQTPLYQALKEWKDPFRGEDPKLLDLQDKIDATKKEIELLKASLEEKKLRQEIKELESSMESTVLPGTPRSAVESESTEGNQEKSDSLRMVLVQAILVTDEGKSALLVSGDKKTWVHEGDWFDGWEIKEIRLESVVLLREGKTFVFFYDRPGITGKGES